MNRQTLKQFFKKVTESRQRLQNTIPDILEAY